ncbi:(2Fe-2S)-binding protein [Zobellella sp. DQSA1]|uniref:(2Fe-2S)-binding protein n=1 Tax=Zobellella sp. DQSA1 TaxID=3342386 RepID=UPI0035BFBED2
MQAIPSLRIPLALPTLAEELAELSARLGESGWSAGAAGPDWTPAAALMTPGSKLLEGWLEHEGSHYPDTDLKTRCAFLLGRYAWYLALPLAGLLLGGRLPGFGPAQLALKMEEYSWRHDGREGTARRLLLRFCAPYPADAGEDAERRLRLGLEAHLAPLVSLLHRRSGLPERGLWCLVADSVAQAFLHAGQRLGCEARAKALALAVLKTPDSPLYNRKTGFIDIALPDPDHPGRELARRSFRTRAGCCRFYTTRGGHYCTTCVREHPENRDRRLREFIQVQLAAG